MTTIVYSNGEIACDSRITAAGSIQSDKAVKRFVQDGHEFYMSGSVPDWHLFREAFCTGVNPGDLKVGAFVVLPDKRIVRTSTNEDGSIWMSELDRSEVYALGSGGDHAITAVDCGLSVRDAVRMAAKRDSATGGRIRVYRV